ncbi:serine/arginine repetitive matrix protein 2 isoform X7 [Carassius gibelio]|uniref:serine/arginine repetitive matrix protein 2 isoform X1 n=1 Tax=Carassius gibelio TaxID=101364 RepID=UPI00227853BE|nr:serine/arginine repetitive matrix protein 2 isoform X1 [Carassius gibelio]XP_052462889.1 serine/arginine repetitive matrix protein 2 isoform X2 [Carassius gibelio]XP_052462890.1 serine/arginine repetitive matrix protein 2 isoform X3 [Carassius gibelio]XP_052462892.1 serine/arginine repetitive matrix protein 2 isoform X4 [Carassius gibelio]XP_052462893.1 serine/arginine repetitive matrix protein 2 isoform X5 [Carassius gibelio]XP_052462894.1 serine/arginine repetitive matrix protein 2 isofor
MPDESKKTHDSSFLYLITVINKSLHLSNPQAIMSQGLRRAPKKKNYADYIQDISSSDYLIPSPPPPQNYRGICTFPEPPKKYDTASKPSTASVPKNKKGNKPMKRVHSKMDPAEIFSEDLFSTPPTTNPCAMSPLDDHEMSTQSSCQQTPQRLSPIIELSTPHSMDSTRIDTPKRTKQAFRGRFSDLPICTSTPAFRTERQSRTPQSRISHASRTERQSRSPQVRNPQASRTERQSRTPQSRISQASRTERQSRSPQVINPQASRTERQSRSPQVINPQASRTERQSRSPQVRNPQASRTERQSMTPQSRISQASRTERQSRSPQVRNPQASRTERQSRSPQVRNPQASRTERQSRSPQVRNPQASRTERQSRTPQSRISQASRTERQSRSPQVRNPQASRTERQSMTPQSRISQASRTERQSGSPQVRNPQEKKDRFPMTDKRFQKKVLTQLLEIKDELRRIGKIVEPETGFHMSTLGTEDEFEYLERQLESGNTRAAMVTQLCKIGGKNFKDSTRRMLDSVLKNSLMSTFNMKGGGPLQKKSFQSTALFSVIRDAVMTSFPSATELEIKTAISNHFKQAPGRAGGGGYGSKVNS